MGSESVNGLRALACALHELMLENMPLYMNEGNKGMDGQITYEKKQVVGDFNGPLDSNLWGSPGTSCGQKCLKTPNLYEGNRMWLGRRLPGGPGFQRFQ